MLEILEPTIGPLELFLVWGTAEDRESLLDSLQVGHIVVAFEGGGRSRVALVIRRQSLFITT